MTQLLFKELKRRQKWLGDGLLTGGLLGGNAELVSQQYAQTVGRLQELVRITEIDLHDLLSAEQDLED